MEVFNAHMYTHVLDLYLNVTVKALIFYVVYLGYCILKDNSMLNWSLKTDYIKVLWQPADVWTLKC